MRIADFSPDAATALKAGLDTFLSGIGGKRLLDQGLDVKSLRACGVLAEARLDLKSLPRFLTVGVGDRDAFFSFLRVCLFAGDQSIGSATMARTSDGGYTLEHVSLYRSTFVLDGLAAVEKLPGSAEVEVRVLEVTPVYLKALVLLRHGSIESFLVLAPPSVTSGKTVAPEAFRKLATALKREHRKAYKLIPGA